MTGAMRRHGACEGCHGRRTLNGGQAQIGHQIDVVQLTITARSVYFHQA